VTHPHPDPVHGTGATGPRDPADPALRHLTDRLLLRPWLPRDRAPFAAMNADPRVMEHFPAALTRRESDELIERMQRRLLQDGYGLWALELRSSGDLIGFTGLTSPSWTAPFTPCVEVGWRLTPAAWGAGYAAEAGRAALAIGFGRAGLEEVVSFTVPANTRSRAVMRRLGLTHDEDDDFEHPAVPVGHPMRRHVLYRLRREDWERSRHIGGPQFSSR
jgi:RimJ/RimL family protein N-acetyltransferase